MAPRPIQGAVERWLDSLDAPDAGRRQAWRAALVAGAPKRFTIYEPLALLPAGSFGGAAWAAELARRDARAQAALWTLVLGALSRHARGGVALTHLAVNEGIPARDPAGGGDGGDNVRRSPAGLRMLLGDFGPARADEPAGDDDFGRALWVSTRQNGIVQTWAPRWTMFSRGNVKEKARLLGLAADDDDDGGGGGWAVDLYAGIGYFSLCYAARGLRVLCWDVNGWSVEGLRRGARANGWTVRVVRGADLALPLAAAGAGGERLVVFLEGNEAAAARMRAAGPGLARRLRHVNCGLLPTSRPSWRATWELARPSPACWLHLHENVGAGDVDARRASVDRLVAGWAAAEGRGARTAAVAHVERVKTFAPGVWHCVFDVRLTTTTKATST